MVKVGILGGSGYGGSELLRILLLHPEAEVALVSANEHAGKRVDAVHPGLAGFTDLTFAEQPDPEDIEEFDCVFLALPHGHAMEIAPAVPANVKIIDLSGDFRLSDEESFKQYYGFEHRAPISQKEFVYGLTEVNRDLIRAARCIANPGCFATAVELGLYPFVVSGRITGKVIADLKTGSSGSGAKASAVTHHPKRASSFYAYKIFEHQHQPEVEEFLTAVDPDWESRCRLVFQTHSTPLVRGIFASIYFTTPQPMENDEVLALFEKHYQRDFFIRLKQESPDVNWVKNTNFADIGWAAQGDTVIVFVAIDNLVKGAAGQAVQNMNVMFGIEETTGLRLPGNNP